MAQQNLSQTVQRMAEQPLQLVPVPQPGPLRHRMFNKAQIYGSKILKNRVNSWKKRDIFLWIWRL